ncbi:MAG: hypothetical protein OQL20_07830, partial [Sedimenticola sp.]|nr:hypothetical protein [Sedimenticola sp.]
SYYLSLALTSGGFEVTYDQLNHQGEPYEQNEMFAATAALKNTGQWLHLNSLSRPQRIGPGEFAPIVAWVGSESLQLFKDPGMDGWWRVQRQNGTQGYLSVVDLPEYINEERK